MRYAQLLLPVLLIAAPVVAQAPAAPPTAPIVIPPELSDPALADRLARVSVVLTKSLMNLPVGEIEAALEGRPVSPADRGKTVRDNIGDPKLEQRVAAQAAASGRTMQVAMKALVGSLPAIMGAMAGAKVELERALGNLPDPTYPRR